MAKGGKRAGAGRKKGSQTRRTQEIVAAVSASGESPLEYMLRVMRTETDEKRRDAMAIAAAPYLHPRLAAVEHTGDREKPIAHEIVGSEAHAFAGRIAGLAAVNGTGEGTSEH